MDSEVKIPTLLGISILVAGIILGVFLVVRNQILDSKASQVVTPKEIKVVNVGGNSASVYWQTDEKAQAFIQAGTVESLGSTFRDDRDIATPQPHRYHFVTLTNLLPETTYYYKITSGKFIYPIGKPLSFKTAASQKPTGLQPLIGTVITSAKEPVDEALITLDIPGNQPLATITKLGGSFILPLNQIKIDNPTVVKLVAFDGTRGSQVKINLPLKVSTLPPITLGEDIDLSALIPSPSPSPSVFSRFDLNEDGVVNAPDLSIVIKNRGKNPKDKRADLNGDGVVDQKDINLINQNITDNAAKR